MSKMKCSQVSTYVSVVIVSERAAVISIYFLYFVCKYLLLLVVGWGFTAVFRVYSGGVIRHWSLGSSLTDMRRSFCQ